MPDVVLKETGQVAQVSAEEATQGLLSGQATLRKGRNVVVRGDDGALFELAPEDVGQALQDGFALAEDEEVRQAKLQQEHGDLAGQAMTVAEQAADAATLGASALLREAAGGKGASERALEREEANPGSAMLGTGLGVIAPALASGGTSTAAQVLRGVSAPASLALRGGLAAEKAAGAALAGRLGTGVLGRAATTGGRLAAGGAVEGALFGAAKVARDDFMADTDVTAERIALGAAKGAAGGALFGGVLGAAGSLAASGARAAKGAVANKLTVKAVEDFAAEASAKAALGGRNLRQVKLVMKKKGGVERVGRNLLEDEIVGTYVPLEETVERAVAKMDEHGRTLTTIERQIDDAARANGTRLPSGSELSSRIREKVLKPLRESPAGVKLAKSVERKLEPVMRHLDELGESTVTELRALRRDVDDKLVQWEKVKQTKADEHVIKARGEMEDYIEETIERIGKEMGDDGAMHASYLDTKQRYESAAWASEAGGEAVARDMANRRLSPSDYGVGTMMGMGDAVSGGTSASSIATGFVSGLVHKIVRERGNAFMAGTADKLARNYRAKALLDATRGEEVVESTGKSVIKWLSGKAKPAARAAKSAAVATGVTSAERYARVADHVRDLNQPESQASQRFQQEVAGVQQEHPQLAASMQAQQQRKASFLGSKLRATGNAPGERGMFGHKKDPRVSPREMRRLMRYVDAADNPKAVMDRISSGDIRREDVETLQAVYPKLYERLVNRVMIDLATMEDPPPNRKRRRLGILLDAPTDQSLQPAFILRTQQMLQQAKQGPQQQGDQVLAPSRRKPPEVSGMYETRIDKILGAT